MSGLLTISVQEARGFTAIPADLDRLAIVMGCSSAGSGLSSFFLSGSSAIASVGYGDAVDTLCQIIEQRRTNGNGVKYPAAMYTTPAGTQGSYGSVDTTGVTGSAVIGVDSSVHPYSTDEARLLVVDGGIIGVSGITFKWSRDAGRSYSNTIALGTALSYTIPNSNIKFTLSPSTTNAAYVTLAVELRADTLAHLANVTAHDAADTSSAQVALAASSVPGTVSASTAVVNLVLAALVAHVTNITAHDGPDLVARNALAALSAATDARTGIDLAIALKGIINTHEGVSLAAAPAGLMGSTASIASPQTYTAASNFLSGGVAAMDAQPRRPEFVISGSGTPADMADSVTLTGFDYADNAQTETGLSLTGLGTVKATKAFKGTGLSCAFVAADGTGATFTIGYSNGVHNSADATNTITSADPTYGTLNAGDIVAVRTFGPVPGASDIDAAFTALANGSAEFSLVVCDWEMTAALLAHVTTGLDALAARGKRCTALFRPRLPDFESSETEATWLASVAAEYLSYSDSRICARGGYHLVTDAMTTRQYLRSNLQQFAADVVRVPRAEWPCAPADLDTGLGGEPNVTLVDSTGATVGHDEGVRGAATGLSNDTLGNRFACEQRITEASVREAVFNTVPWVMYASDERIRNLPTRRLANAIERVAVAAGIPKLGGKVFYTRTSPTTGILTPASRKAIQGDVYRAVAGEFGTEIDNAKDAAIDTGLVQISSSVTISGGNLVAVSGTLAPRIGGFVVSLNFTLAIQE